MGNTYSTLYARLPGLISIAAGAGASKGQPLRAVAVDKIVRDATVAATRCGVRVTEPLIRARRHCPALLVTPLESIDVRSLTAWQHRFLDVLTSVTPIVEPDGWDGVYTDLAGGPMPDVEMLAQQWSKLGTGFAPLIGFGASRNAARACAECGLPPERLADADSRWLWPEDPAVGSRLFRLGLSTYGAVADIGESALVYQFGKQGRLLHLRSLGRDLAPVRALYPAPQVKVMRAFHLEPLTQEPDLRHVIGEIAAVIAQELSGLGRHARRLSLRLQTEREHHVAEWVLPAPVQQTPDVLTALRRLRQQITISAPVIALAVEALDLDLPTASTGSLFDTRATERKLAVTSTRQRLRAKFGNKALQYLGEMPLPRRETRKALRQEALR